MEACYHDDIAFSDPAFPDLRGKMAGGMWRMLCSQAKNFELVYSGVEADDKTGRAHWQATYTFSVTGRKVVNEIDAVFEFKDGKIIKHTDTFDFYKWSKMALGTPGYLLGWTGFLKKKVQTQAAKIFMSS